MPTISAKINDEAYLKFKQLATDNNLTMSKMITQAITKSTIVDVKKEKSIELEILHNLNKIGNNLNQISKHCNTKKSVDVEVLKTLLEIEEAVKDLS